MFVCVRCVYITARRRSSCQPDRRIGIKREAQSSACLFSFRSYWLSLSRPANRGHGHRSSDRRQQPGNGSLLGCSWNGISFEANNKLLEESPSQAKRNWDAIEAARKQKQDDLAEAAMFKAYFKECKESGVPAWYDIVDDDSRAISDMAADRTNNLVQRTKIILCIYIFRSFLLCVFIEFWYAKRMPRTRSGNILLGTILDTNTALDIAEQMKLMYHLVAVLVVVVFE
eukprot:g7637.t1